MSCLSLKLIKIDNLTRYAIRTVESHRIPKRVDRSRIRTRVLVVMTCMRSTSPFSYSRRFLLFSFPSIFLLSCVLVHLAHQTSVELHLPCQRSEQGCEANSHACVFPATCYVHHVPLSCHLLNIADKFYWREGRKDNFMTLTSSKYCIKKQLSDLITLITVIY